VGPGGNGLRALKDIDLSGLDSRLRRTQLLVACDVDNPLLGHNGSAAVFGPQKGATPSMVKELDKALGKLAKLIQRVTGKEISKIPGAGAAGGISGSFNGLLDAQLRPGSDLVFDLLSVKKVVPKMDLIITGEGKIDFQTPFGKGPGMLARLAQRHNVPVIFDRGFVAIFSIVNRPMELEFALRNAASLMKSISEQIARLLRLRTKR